MYFQCRINFSRKFSFKPLVKQKLLTHNSHIKVQLSVKYFSHSETMEKTIVSIRHRFPQNDPASHIQKDLDLLTDFFRSVLDQLKLVDDPDTSQFLTLLFLFNTFSKFITISKLYQLFQIIKPTYHFI